MTCKNLLFFVCFFYAQLAFGQLDIVSGDVGIGTTSPSGKLHVKSGAELVVNVESTNPVGRIFVNSTSNSGFNFAIHGTKRWSPACFQAPNTQSNYDFTFWNEQESEPALLIDGDDNNAMFAGSVSANGFVNTSDENLKENIQDFNNGLATILKLNPISFRYNKVLNKQMSNRTFVGIKAQELQKVAPQLVSTQVHTELNDNMETTGKTTEYLSIQADGLQYILVNAIKEQQQLIETLQKEIGLLKAKIK